MPSWYCCYCQFWPSNSSWGSFGFPASCSVPFAVGLLHCAPGMWVCSSDTYIAADTSSTCSTDLYGVWLPTTTSCLSSMVMLFSLLIQGKLERSALYALRQAALARAAATCIQAVWRGRMARQLAATLQVLQQQQRKLGTAAAAIQVGTAVQLPCMSHITACSPMLSL